MCTGDFIDTAIAISKEARILTEKDIKKLVDQEEGNQYVAITGEEFRTKIGGHYFDEDPNDKKKKIVKIRNMKAFKEIV